MGIWKRIAFLLIALTAMVVVYSLSKQKPEPPKKEGNKEVQTIEKQNVLISEIPSGGPKKVPDQEKVQDIADIPKPIESRFIWPINSDGRYISQNYDSTGDALRHTGVDLDWRNGTDIIASDSGVVADAQYGWGGGYGKYIIINHDGGYQTLYSHLADIKVDIGQGVIRGQSIGTMGNSGLSNEVHLHFEIRKDGVAVDPLAAIGTK